MEKNEALAAVGPCGINCGDCELHKAKDDQGLLEALVSKGIKRERLPCPGCRPVRGKCPVIGGTCRTYECVQQRRFDFCYECPDFPCDKLNPAADRADILPHNLKVFNLCTIQRLGVEGFIAQSAELEKMYFKGKMKIGKGPQL